MSTSTSPSLALDIKNQDKMQRCIHRTIEVPYNAAKSFSNIKREEIVGYTHVRIYKYGPKNSKGHALLVKCNMEPNRFIDLNGRYIYGFSQYLKISSNLPSNCSIDDNTPTNSSTGSNSYSVGLTVGDSLSFSGSVECINEHCNVTDLTRISQKYFGASYDYKPHSRDINPNSKRNKALFRSTSQCAGVSWDTYTNDYHTYVTIKSKFGIATNMTGAHMLGPLNKTSSSNYEHFRISYC